jgi:hypothetical protein
MRETMAKNTAIRTEYSTGCADVLNFESGVMSLHLNSKRFSVPILFSLCQEMFSLSDWRICKKKG